MNIKNKIQEIILKNTGTINSFVDDTGKNHFMDTVDQLGKLVENTLTIQRGEVIKEIEEKVNANRFYRKDGSFRLSEFRKYLNEI